MPQQNLHFLYNKKGLGLSRDRKLTLKSCTLKNWWAEWVPQQSGCRSRTLALPFHQVAVQLGPHHPRWFGVLFPHFRYSLNKRTCPSLLCLAESRYSINICWMSLIILMKRDSFVLLGHWVYHLLNGLWLPGLTNLRHLFMSFSPTGFNRIPVAILTKGGQEDPSILASTSGLKGTNQNFHHIPSGTHWSCQHLRSHAWAIYYHVDTHRPLWKMEFLNYPEWPAYMCRQRWSPFPHILVVLTSMWFLLRCYFPLKVKFLLEGWKFLKWFHIYSLPSPSTELLIMWILIST